MFKVNLQKKLIVENEKLLTDQDLLVMKETDKFMSEEELKKQNIEILKSAGFGLNLKERKKIDKKIKEKKEICDRFGAERVFTVEQIEKVAKNYYLKFLPVEIFKGNLPEELPYEISKFKEVYLKKIVKEERFIPNNDFTSRINSNDYIKVKTFDKVIYESLNLYIMAPKSSFNLVKEPKDPLLFHKVNERYYVLLYKWGNDLSIFRRILSFISNDFGYFLISNFFAIIMRLIIPIPIENNLPGVSLSIITTNILFLIFLTILNLINISNFFDGDEYGKIIKKIKPFSEFRD